jgi:hypothetical protein
LPIAVALLVLGWGEIFAGLALKDRAFLQGTLVIVWLGSAIVLIFLGIFLLSPSAQTWISRGLSRRRR